jgi:class 3 adenylate cyclase
MEYHIFHESSKWREARDKRIISFLKFSAYIMIIGGLIWTGVMLVEQLFLVAFTLVVMVSMSVYALMLIRKGAVAVAKNLIFISASSYFLIVCVFFDGPDEINKEPGTAYFWFIVLAIFFYFIHYDSRPLLRDSVSLFFLLIFFLFHFHYLSFTSLIHVEQRELINQVTVVTVLLTTYFLTRQFAVRITQYELALTDSADRLQGLVENILPKSIADRLTSERRSFADSFSECSVLFADIAGFTVWSEKHTASEVAELLNNIFSRFDEAVERMNLTKIKTSGDSYMVVAGLPEARSDHAAALTMLALEFHTIAAGFDNLLFRIGINSGSVAAGVIGKKRFIYDLWGDTVNTASRMESSGEIGKVNISGSTYELIKNKFICNYRGKIEAKSKGEIDMYFVEAVM